MITNNFSTPTFGSHGFKGQLAARKVVPSSAKSASAGFVKPVVSSRLLGFAAAALSTLGAGLWGARSYNYSHLLEEIKPQSTPVSIVDTSNNTWQVLKDSINRGITIDSAQKPFAEKKVVLPSVEPQKGVLKSLKSLLNPNLQSEDIRSRLTKIAQIDKYENVERPYPDAFDIYVSGVGQDSTGKNYLSLGYYEKTKK